MVEELRTIDCNRVGFVDDNFLINYKRDHEIADRIKAEGLERQFLMQCRTDYIVRHRALVEKWVTVGLDGVLLGLEGASDDILQLVNKNNSIAINNSCGKRNTRTMEIIYLSVSVGSSNCIQHGLPLIFKPFSARGQLDQPNMLIS